MTKYLTPKRQNKLLFLLISLTAGLLACSSAPSYFSEHPRSAFENLNIHVMKSARTARNRLILRDSVISELNRRFSSDPDEFRACLTGTLDGNGVATIDSLYYPRHFNRTPEFLDAEECRPSTLVELHTHPVGNCLPSENDWDAIKTEGYRMFGVMCGLNQIFVVTGSDDPKFVRVISDATFRAIDISMFDPCGDAHFCNGSCFTACTSNAEFQCESSGGICYAR